MVDVSIRHIEVFDYDDLLELSRDASRNGEQRSVLLHRFIGALGPSGCGIIGIRGVQHLPQLRNKLLPLAPLLAVLPHKECLEILKTHGLGTDVSLKDPNRLVSSFAAQLRFSDDSNDGAQMVPTNKLRQLGCVFRQLGKEMVDIGLLIARICDMAIEGSQLENAILEACTAKGRLIHYHSMKDKLRLEAVASSHRSQRKSQVVTEVLSNKLWQEWHFDYGIFTVLTAPMFCSGIKIDAELDYSEETNLSFCALPSENSFEHIGLKILNVSTSQLEFVSVPTDCFVVQVGEAAEILTGGKLRATAHCVCRPDHKDDVSRETFVVFLQPNWNKRLISPYPIYANTSSPSNYKSLGAHSSEFEEIKRKVPALSLRWKDGCTFAEFSKETTKQYYGTNGAQSNNK